MKPEEQWQGKGNVPWKRQQTWLSGWIMRPDKISRSFWQTAGPASLPHVHNTFALPSPKVVSPSDQLWLDDNLWFHSQMAMSRECGRRRWRRVRPQPNKLWGGLAAVSEGRHDGGRWCRVLSKAAEAGPSSKQAHHHRPPSPLWQRLVGPPTNQPPTHHTPLSADLLPFHRCSPIEKPLRPSETQGAGRWKRNWQFLQDSGGRRGWGEGIRTNLPSWRPRWVSPSWESHLCRDNTDAVRDGNAIGQFRSKLLPNRRKKCSVAKHGKVRRRFARRWDMTKIRDMNFWQKKWNILNIYDGRPLMYSQDHDNKTFRRRC